LTPELFHTGPWQVYTPNSMNTALVTEAKAISPDLSALGPESTATMLQRLSSGTLSPEDLVWNPGMTEWCALRHTNLCLDLKTPPPLTGSSVNNLAVWFWAFVPLIPISSIMIAMGLTPHQSSTITWKVAFAINTLFWWLDGQQLKHSGHNRSGWGWWGIFLVPVYLFIRAAKLKQSNAYAIVWLVCLAVGILIELAPNVS
jgi:GYF domain 2